VIGQCTYIDVGVHVGSHCKIQNGVSVYQGVTLGDAVFVGPSATFTNDLYPRARSPDWQVSPTLVEAGASIGANATIRCGITLGSHCMVGAGAVVVKDVPAHALVVGQPAHIIDYVNRSGRPLGWDLSRGMPPPDLLEA
jgi:acetyltransferase-like isoleucine patch superfamily enzyme